jgi:hypothetical protein
MKKKVIIIIFSCFLLLFLSIGVNAINLSQKPININSKLYQEPSANIDEDYNEKNIPLKEPTIHANSGGPYTGSVNQPIKFNILGTSIPQAVEYYWDFDDDNDQTSGFGKNPYHIYSEPGIYYSTLTVKDENDNLYSDIAPVYIDKPGDHLKPYGGCYYYGAVDEKIRFDASKSISKGAEIIEYFWDFGDGSTAYGETVYHEYKAERVYLVTLEITDSNGISRHDVLHADIGITYSRDEDFFNSLPESIEAVCDFLLNKENLQLSVFNGLLDTKIYTNYNGQEKLTDLSGLFPLPVEIDVNGNGVNDINVKDLKYFRLKKGPSLFDRDSRIWFQFETTISEINKISSDITIEDDFTVCLQLDFGFIADRLGLDDTIIRMGYNSPAGEEMPNSISITHILRPYLLFRILGLDKSHTKDVNTDILMNQPFAKTSIPEDSGSETPKAEYDDISNSILPLSSENTKTINNNGFEPIYENLKNSGNLERGSVVRGFKGKYWPEYGLRIRSSGGGDFYLFTMLLNTAGSSKTTVKISYGSSTSTMMYKRSKIGGILNHAAIFEIPGDEAKLIITRQRNSEITEMSTRFKYSSMLSRGIGWGDSGLSFTLDGETSVDVYDFYFENPNYNLSFKKIALSLGGYIDFELIDGMKLELDGNGGFEISDLSFKREATGLDLGINGSLFMDVDGFVHVGIATGLLEIGFDGNLHLSSDCVFYANDQTVTTGGDFNLGSDGIISFTWGSDLFSLDLEAGALLKIDNMRFKVGDLTANATMLEIGASGKFEIGWDTQTSEVTISGGSDVSLGLEDVEITYGSTLIVKVIGTFNIAADGYITFGPNVFKAGFSGMLDLGTSCEFEINGEGLKVGGAFELDSGNGEISFSWDDDGFSLYVSGSPQLSVSALFFEIGDLTVSADSVGIGASGQFNIGWDTSISEVIVSGASGSSLAITNVNINYQGTLDIKIIGSLEIQADGYITFGPDTFKAGFSGSLDLGSECEFEINGDRIKVGGLFTLSSGNGEISFNWAEDEFSLSVSGSPELSVSELFFEVGDLKISSKYVGICASGEFNIEWDVQTNEITIRSGVDSALEIEDLDIKYGSNLNVQIFGAFSIQADGYITFAPGVFKAGFIGTLDLGTGCEFVINGDSISVGGAFSLSSGNGEIEFNWADDQFNLYISGGPSLEVSELYFNAGDLTVNAGLVGIGAYGEFNIDLDLAKSEIMISSGGGVSLQVSDLDIDFSSTLDVSIIGSLEIQADGYIVFAPGVFKANFAGSLNLGTGGSYCEFEINGQSIKIGGEFSLSSGSGEISFEWDDNSLKLEVQGSPELYISDLYFEAGDLTVSGEYVGIGVSGEFNVDLNTASQEVTISGTSGISLSIENIEITYDTILDVKILGSFDIQAGGYITFGPGIFKTGFEGTLDLGAQTQFEINGDSITVGGIFSLIGNNGEISFLWDEGSFELEVSGGPKLEVENFYFETNIQDNDLMISIDDIEIGAYGDLTLEWYSSQSKIEIRSDAGASLIVSEVQVMYGSMIDIKIIGTLNIQVDGSVSLAPGSFETSFSGSIELSPGFGFEIDGESIFISGQFSIPQGSGDVMVSWSDEEISIGVSGGAALGIKYFSFEAGSLRVDSNDIFVQVNGVFTLLFDDGIDKFEIGSSTAFKIISFSFDVYLDNQWETIIYLQEFEIGGGGYILIDSGSDPKIEADFNVKFNLLGLSITPPASWNCGLNIGSSNIQGSGKINIYQTPEGEASFDITGGSFTGTMSTFNAFIELGGTEFDIMFSDLQIGGSFSFYLEDYLKLGGGGNLKINNIVANFGNYNIASDINLEGDGNFDGLWANIQFELDFSADFVWDIYMESTSIGDWELYGNLVGDINLDAEWTESSGAIEMAVNSNGFLHSISVVHNDYNLTLGEFMLTPGIITFDWVKDESSNQGYFHINSGISVSINLAKLSWDSKSLEFGLLNVKSGEFKFAWDQPLKTFTINNGMASFGPQITYSDTSQELEVSAAVSGLQSDYSKTITLMWYEENSQIVGIYLDTSDTYLAQYLQISYIKGDSGKKVTVFGLQCNDFFIKKEDGEFKWGGEIFIANRVTFSKLVDSIWADLDVRWNFQLSEKWIRFERDEDFELKLTLFETEILGFTISSEINLMNGNYFEVRWDIGVSGKVYIDTNWEYLVSLNILIGPDFGIGLDASINALRAEDWWVEWTAWPPEEWNVQSHGTLQAAGIIIDVYYDGEWKHLWPW